MTQAKINPAILHWARERQQLSEEAHRRYYAFDIAPGFWNGLIRLAEEQTIAHAKAHRLSVVTMESLKNESQSNTGRVAGKIHIPNVCRCFNVPYQDTFTLLREQKIVLR